MRAEAQQLHRPGAHLVFSSQRLVMAGVAGQEAASTVLTITSTGTAAVYYRWHRLNSCDGNGQGSQVDADADASADAEAEEIGKVAGHEANCTEQTASERCPPPPRQGPACFYLTDQRGSILPGEAREFVFSFRSAVAGVFTEEWAMATTPPLSSMGMRHKAGDPVKVRRAQQQ